VAEFRLKRFGGLFPNTRSGHSVRELRQFAEQVHPELLPTRRQVEFWAKLGRALVAEKKMRDKGVRVLLHAERLAPQRVRHEVLVREAVAGLWRQARRDAGDRELRGLAWRMGIAPIG
jgi:hypothetical protein